LCFELFWMNMKRKKIFHFFRFFENFIKLAVRVKKVKKVPIRIKDLKKK